MWRVRGVAASLAMADRYPVPAEGCLDRCRLDNVGRPQWANGPTPIAA